jgi:NADH:ubiquinone oxidoreductase subunit H
MLAGIMYKIQGPVELLEILELMEAQYQIEYRGMEFGLLLMLKV